ncbi:MAG: hypothetical protein FJX31_03230 [Alphaproteobacteria bacterium]|nr:hypothetical protein [Alphaproteobacteria bacterium]
MQPIGDETHITSTEKRDGVTNHSVRYVLMFSLLLAIVVLSAIWIRGALTREDCPSKPPVRVQGVDAKTG